MGEKWAGVPMDEVQVGIVSPVRIYREGLSHLLRQEPGIQLVELDAEPDVVLLDVVCGLGELARQATGARRVLVVGILESPDELIAYAEGGMAGYVSSEGTLDDLVHAIRQAAVGTFSMPSEMAQRMAVRVRQGSGGQLTMLTHRERQVIDLVEAGLTNKEIARRLGIQLATVKNHVHNILGKLGANRRAQMGAILRGERLRV
ncbi:response regulator transcription factor [Nonomuraea sp. NN258]|uniref:LuxR C-terminal-related transcriptional regulator n=1 Tax=Nonomuraea antri TaxID=2730852 RepID=UPI001569EC79|nr:response regulator transcription factor [Nonomuraea antri]NRQ31944.1 response regulator transcription factor [Nonomuraea antri]